MVGIRSRLLSFLCLRVVRYRGIKLSTPTRHPGLGSPDFCEWAGLIPSMGEKVSNGMGCRKVHAVRYIEVEHFRCLREVGPV